jgi:hypothetical protein
MMNVKKAGCVALIALISVTSCDSLDRITKVAQKKAGSYGVSGSLSNGDIIKGLKQALTIGTGNASRDLNKPGAYLKNALIRIPFPKEVQQVATKLRSLGMNTLVDNFEKSMNTAAERAAIKAKPIFVSAITGMNVSDAVGILKGNKNAATVYFKSKTSNALKSAFRPEISKALSAVNATKYWTDITSAYNKLPFVTKVNTNLTNYVTDKALDGLFLKVAQEELKIRDNPSARVTDILRKVFG